MIIGSHEFDLENKGYIMGILNVTPDSFSDGGKYTGKDQALFQAEKMIKAGAAILDVGGESTRPGYEKISDEEEIHRVAPVIEGLREHFDIPISLDTYKSKVARAGIKAGADLINDIWGLQYDMQMGAVIAEHNVACCLMHNRDNRIYDDFLSDFMRDMNKIITIAKKAGIPDNKIILDPGVGFAKSYEQNLLITKHIDMMKELQYPILLGTSRKSMIGNALGLPVEEREEGTAVTTVMGRMKGVSLFRVHDVKTNFRALQMTDAILQVEEQQKE